MHRSRRLVVTQALERRCTQMPVVRPLRELDLAHELRLDPHDVALAHLRHLRLGGERAGVSPQRLELLQEPVDVVLGEAGAAVADPVDVVPAIRPEHERAEAPGAPALSLRPAADDELLALVRLELQPVAAAPAFEVARLRALRHHAFEPTLERRGEEPLAVVEGRRDLHRRLPWVEQLLQPRAAFRERQIEQRHAVDLEHVEHRIDDRRVRLALLHRREARAAVAVEGAHLAVDDAVGRPRCMCERSRDPREARRQVVVVARDETGHAGADVAEGAVAVPFDLVCPAVAPRQLRRECREHRPVVAPQGAARRSRLIVLPDQEPVLRIAVHVRGDERPRALEARTVQAHRETAVRLLLEELVRAGVPDLDRAGAVVALRDLALEARVVERVILDVHGQDALPRLERDALRNGP